MSPFSKLACVSFRCLQVNVEHEGRSVKSLMRGNLQRLLHTEVGQVNVKARTHENLDSVGEGRAVECHVVLTLEKRAATGP